MQLKSAYIGFYCDGREAKLLKNDIDTEALAEKVDKGEGSIHELTLAAVTDAAKSMQVDRARRQWFADYEEEIKTAGGDQEEAYRHFVQGKIDELVYALEPEVYESLSSDGEDDEDEEGEDEEDEEDE